MHFIWILDHIQHLEHVHIHHLVIKEILKLINGPSRLRAPILLHHWSHSRVSSPYLLVTSPSGRLAAGAGLVGVVKDG